MEQYLNTNTNINTTTNIQPQGRFVAFQNIMRPMSNMKNFQKDYNNTDVQVELVDESEEAQFLDNSYETNIIKNTVDTVSKVHNIKAHDKSIIKDDTGKYVYQQDIPMTASINNIAQRLFKEIKQNNDEFKHITIEDIRNLIFKRNIREWNQPNIKGFVKELRAFSNQKSVFMINVHAHQHPQIIQKIQPSISQQTEYMNNTNNTTMNNTNNNQLDFQKNLNNSFQTLQDKLNVTRSQIQPQIQTQPIQIQTQPIQIQTVSLTINSDDRNNELYPSPYDFKMIFENKNDNIERVKGTIYQNTENITNITNIQINSVIIPACPDLENLPYLLLEIEEIGDNGSGSNEWLDKCLGKLFFSQKLGKFNIHTDKLSTIEKNFKIPINLNSLTIRIRKPNGDIWVDESELSLTIELKMSNHKKHINQLSLI
jgi:hypothetical protein